MQLDQVDPKVLGQRLTGARKARGVTQEDAANHLGCSRPTFIAIEKGTRPARPEEIVSLAALYGRKVSDLVRPGEPIGDLGPHLRAVAQEFNGEVKEIEQAILALQKFAEDYSRLERILRLPLRLNYPPEISLGAHVDVVGLAEDAAVRERQRLGLGDQPVIHLRSILEAEVGLRIVYEDLPSRIAGMFAFSRDFGGVVAVNRQHPPQRRRATLVHEYGHLLIDRFKPGIDCVSLPARKSRNERFAESFAMAFLMPATSVRARFNQIVNDTGDFQIADLCRLAHYYFVSVEATAIRLESLGLIPKGIRDYLKESRFEVRRASELLALRQHPVSDERFPDRYILLAVQAHDRGEISEGELASLLRCDRVTAREIVAAHLMRTDDVTEDGEARALGFESQSQNSLLKVNA